MPTNVKNNKPEKYQISLLKRINGGSWKLVWTGTSASTAWEKYDSTFDGFRTQFVSGKFKTEFQFQVSTFQNTDSSSAQEILGFR